MSWGLENRLARIIRPETGRTVMLAIDHGYFLGPTKGLECPSTMCTPLVPYADTLMLTRGVLRNCIPSSTGTPIVLRVSGGTSVLQDDLSDETIITSVEECIRLNAVGMALSVFVGAPHQHQSIANLSKLVDEGERYGIPVVAVTAVGKDMGRDARYLSLASRICAEMGAHIVKTYYCEDFEKVTSTCPAPVVVAGGKKLPELEALQLTAAAIAGGAVGVDMGRNIFQAESPVAMIQAVSAVVHRGVTPQEAFDVYREQKEVQGAAVVMAGAALDDERKITVGRRGARRGLPQQLRYPSGRPAGPCHRPGRESSCASEPPASAAPTSWSGTGSPKRRSCWATRLRAISYRREKRSRIWQSVSASSSPTTCRATRARSASPAPTPPATPCTPPTSTPADSPSMSGCLPCRPIVGCSCCRTR